MRFSVWRHLTPRTTGVQLGSRHALEREGFRALVVRRQDERQAQGPWIADHLGGARLLGGGLPLSGEAVAMALDANWAFSSAKAERELGWRARSLHEGLPGTLAWLRLASPSS